MVKKIILAITLVILMACGNHNSPGLNQNNVNLNSLTGMNWYQRTLETESLIEINIKDSIPKTFTQYLTSIDSNFRMASEGEIWQVGCSPPAKFHSDSIKTIRDEKTGQIWSTAGYVEVDAPSRKLDYFGQNEKMAALIYTSGGIGVMQHLVLFKIEKGEITEHWHGNTKGNISTQKEIMEKMVNGELEEITSYI